MKAPRKKIVIGYDGAPASEEIFMDLAQAGLPPELDATVVCAADLSLPVMVGGLADAALAREQDEVRAMGLDGALAIADRAAKRLRVLFPGWKVSAEADCDAPGWAIVGVAERKGADLIVVGAHGHSGLGRFLGSVSQQVLIHAPCSVRVSRATHVRVDRNPMIVLAIDSSPESQLALLVAADRTWVEGTEIRVLSVVPNAALLGDFRPPDVPVEPFQSTLRHRAAEELVARAAGVCDTAGFASRGVVRVGDPKTLIVAEADRLSAAAIVMGARGLSATHRLLLGSVSLAVAARAHCSVEVVRVRAEK